MSIALDEVITHTGTGGTGTIVTLSKASSSSPSVFALFGRHATLMTPDAVPASGDYGGTALTIHSYTPTLSTNPAFFSAYCLNPPSGAQTITLNFPTFIAADYFHICGATWTGLVDSIAETDFDSDIVPNPSMSISKAPNSCLLAAYIPPIPFDYYAPDVFDGVGVEQYRQGLIAVATQGPTGDGTFFWYENDPMSGPTPLNRAAAGIIEIIPQTVTEYMFWGAAGGASSGVIGAKS